VDQLVETVVGGLLGNEGGREGERGEKRRDGQRALSL
jgi:hypothetical protein